MTTIVYFADPTKEDVEIAGNFTGWAPEKLHLNKDSGRFEYTVAPSEQAGQLNFKFIVDGNWVCDQNYASGEYRTEAANILDNNELTPFRIRQ
jgi:1,4-alpha-glucan branching enzyme